MKLRDIFYIVLRLSVVAFIASLILGHHPAQAAEPYISITLGESFTGARQQADPPGSPPNIAPYVYSGSLPIARLAVGLRLTERLDFEFGAGSLARSQQSRANIGPGYDTSGYNINAREVDIRGRYWVSVAPRLAVFGELGLASVLYHASQWRYTDTPDRGEGHGWAGGWVDSRYNVLAPQIGVGVGYKLGVVTITAVVTQTRTPEFKATQAMIGARWDLK